MSNELVVSEDSGAGARPAPSEGFAGGVGRAGIASRPADAARKAEIEQIMKTDFARYEDEGLNREYLELLEAELAEADPDSGNPTRPMRPEDSRVLMCSSAAGQRLVVAWERYGGFSTHLANVQRDVAEIVREAGQPRAQRAFMEGFSRSVPMEAETAIADEIATGLPSFVQPASKAEIDLFAQTPVGKALVSEWGSWAPEKVATVRLRAERMTEQMSEEAAADFWEWFEEQDARIVKAIFRKMAGG